jgi:enolase
VPTEPQISRIRAREVLDCRGLPTVQVDVEVDGRFLGRADVPAGRSRGVTSRWSCATAAAVSAASASGGR